MSTYPINTSIPAAGHNPSVDQGPMQTNFLNISGFLGVDHSAPGTTNTAGEHNQVRFALNQSAPALNNAVSELFSNSQAGLFGTISTLFFNDGVASRPMTNLAVTTSGTNWGITTPWGIVFNFGYVTGVSTGGTSQNFAISFPNFAASATISANSNSANFASVKSLTQSAITIAGNNNGMAVYYIAIGW